MTERINILTVVALVFNGEEALPLCREHLTEVLERSGRPYALLFVNDGSSDRNAELLDRSAAGDTRIHVLRSSWSSGHGTAVIAGIDYVEGNVVCVGADLQYSSWRIPGIMWASNEGFDVIDMVCTANRSAGLIKNITSAGLYGIMNALSGARLEKNAPDFFGILTRTVEVSRRDYRERVRSPRGYVQSLGSRSTALSCEATERVADHPRYSVQKLFRFSMNMIMSFSDPPLRFGIYTGIASGAFGVSLLLYSIFMKPCFSAPDGYTTIIAMICFMFSMLFPILGIMGQYIGVLFQEVKGRPIYTVATERGARVAEHDVLTDKKTET